MSKNRDYVAEILSKKTRHLKRAQRWDQFTRRNDPLLQAFDYVEAHVSSSAVYKIELLRYFPIGMTACVEGYFRQAFRDLIDSGTPYMENVLNFRDINFGIQSVLAIHGRTVSLGDFVSHLLPLKSLQDINRNMSVIIGEDFLERLNNTEAEFANELVPFKNLAPHIYREVKEMFRLRHIFAHELAITEKLRVKSLRMMLGAATTFVWETENLMDALLSRAEPNKSLKPTAR